MAISDHFMLKEERNEHISDRVYCTGKQTMCAHAISFKDDRDRAKERLSTMSAAKENAKKRKT